MNAWHVVSNDDWAQSPAISAALDAIERADSPANLSAARDQLRKAELERDISLNLQDLWGDYEWSAARAFGLISGEAA
jgi:hypothetical protein